MYKRNNILWLGLGAAMLMSVPFIVHAGITVNRYATHDILPLREQINPLQAIGEHKFTSEIRTVGDAIEVVLHQIGYELVETNKLSEYVQLTLKKPLPVTARNLGPLKISDSLEVLMGKRVFQLVEDPLQRTIDFKFRKEFASKSGAKNVLRKS